MTKRIWGFVIEAVQIKDKSGKRTASRIRKRFLKNPEISSKKNVKERTREKYFKPTDLKNIYKFIKC